MIRNHSVAAVHGMIISDVNLNVHIHNHGFKKKKKKKSVFFSASLMFYSFLHQQDTVLYHLVSRTLSCKVLTKQKQKCNTEEYCIFGQGCFSVHLGVMFCELFYQSSEKHFTVDYSGRTRSNEKEKSSVAPVSPDMRVRLKIQAFWTWFPALSFLIHVSEYVEI